MIFTRVSIVITCYNYAEYVADAIKSALYQTYENSEIVIVNDGSTDHSHDVISTFLNNPKIKYIRQSNDGQANAKNTGIKNSTGEFIAFLDADDTWEPTKLEKQVKLFQNSRVGVVYSKAKYIDAEGNPLNFKLESKYLQPRSGKVTEWLIFDNFVPFSSSIVRRECFEKVGLFDESLKMGIDWDLWLRISVHYDFDYVDEPLLIYRLGHTGQMSKNIEVRQACSDAIYQKFLTNYPNAVSKDTLQMARYYTYCSRAYYWRTKNKRKALEYYLRGLKIRPLSLGAYKGLARTLVLHKD